jgi:hypothetical protein
MLHDGMVGSENDVSVGEVLVQRECRDRTDGITHGKIGDIFAHGIDATGAIISETSREYRGFDISVVATLESARLMPISLTLIRTTARVGGAAFIIYSLVGFLLRVSAVPSGKAIGAAAAPACLLRALSALERLTTNSSSSCRWLRMIPSLGTKAAMLYPSRDLNLFIDNSTRIWVARKW